ncbi:MAG: ROK family protein [Endomicrobiaceae bacterium]|nr:ROK family protein [Endomicrobiaceae bacterium]
MAKFYLGVDLGGTQIKIAVVDDKAVIMEEFVMDTDIQVKPIKIIKDIVSKIKNMKYYKNVKTIGIGIAGDVDSVKGVLRFSPNLPNWKNVQLKKEMEKLTNKKIFVDNDANTACVGAYWLDLEGKATNIVCVTLGTGVGGGMILNKKLYTGTSGTAGEIGHITVEPNGNKCNCGNKGCAETYIGAKYLVKRALHLMREHNSYNILKLAGNDKCKITPQILSLAASKGDEVAKIVWAEAGEKLAILLADIINFINPDHIVLCGGISKACNAFYKPVYKQIKQRAFKSAVDSCQIIVSKYTNKLGVAGAAMLAKN